MADRRLQVFHAVAKQASFTRAAETLFMSQPAVTSQVKQLEEQFRARLFERRHGNVTLTPAGELVLSYAERILALSDELEARLADMTEEMRGTLRVGATPTIAGFLLGEALGEFNARHPQVRVRLAVANAAEVERRVAGRELDVGLLDAPVTTPGLACASCGEDELVAICAPDHPLAGTAKVKPRALAEYEHVAREPGSGSRVAAESWFAGKGIAADALKIQMELGGLEPLKAVVATGLGFAILSRAAVAAELAAGTLAAVSLEPPLRRGLFAVTGEERFRPRLVGAFAEFARLKLKDLCA
jgi:DNA-binding transcriptional LysR family regulator